ncbi:FAD-binding protein [Thauera butanivorans]|uniref:FAD-binding protein n=1 Tax=Thauera butanivorans TaxID=86174 RepID=UPI003AB69B99
MARYPTSNQVDDDSHDLQHRADVLVIGGSIAGCWAALTARQAGANVVLAEKGYVGTAGVVAAASGGASHTVPGQAEYNQRIIRDRHDAACGIDDLAFIEHVFGQSYEIGLKLKAFGFLPNQGRPGGNRLPGTPERLTTFRGAYTLHFLRTQLRKAGVRILDHSPVLELLMADGRVAGAAGVNRQSGDTWAVRAGAVILATGGNAFRSGAMGTNGITGDGHLMAAEAGAHFVGMEYSGHYGIAPQGSPTTKGFWYGSATFYDAHGRELPINGWAAVPDIARAIMETGAAYASMNRGAAGFSTFARNNANVFQYFDRIGVDPFTQRFRVELLYEGLVRATGGLVVDERAATGIPGLYAAGDVTERTRLTGAGMSGAGPAIAWCLVSAEWAGSAAAADAAAYRRPRGRLEAIGGLGLRPRAKGSVSAAAVGAGVQAEILPISKNVFRSLDSLRDSLAALDGLWDSARAGLQGGGDLREVLKAREAASMLAGARWIYRSAQARTETRGLHRLADHPGTDPAQQDHIVVGGVDDVVLRRAPLTRFQPLGQAA